MLYFDPETLTKMDEIKAAVDLSSRSQVLMMAVDQFWKETLLCTTNPSITFTQSYDNAQGRTIAQLREIALILEITDSLAALRAIERLWSKIVNGANIIAEQHCLVAEVSEAGLKAATVAGKTEKSSIPDHSLGTFRKKIRKFVLTPGFVVLAGQVLVITIEVIRHLISAVVK